MREIINAVQQGHNCLILGHAGTGKSMLLQEIARMKRVEGKTVQVTATTGIAAKQLKGMTLHKFAGLLDGRFSDAVNIARIHHGVDFVHIKDRIMNTSCLLIDEVSMLSFKILMQLDTLFQAVRNNTAAFGGMQIVMSGDFYQLRPVPNLRYNDPGQLLVENPSFKALVPHHYVLTTVHRQNQLDLIEAVRQLSRGIADHNTENLMMRLQRPLPPGPEPVRLFAENYEVDKCNSHFLLEMDDVPPTKYTSEDCGNAKPLDSTAPEHLYLKIGAKVLLTRNLTDQLVNGTLGKVCALLKDSVLVQFEGQQEETLVTYFLYNVYDPQKNKVVACRKQLPLKLGWALTVHKAQGMTLARVEVDCRRMFSPGQIGVAVGRVQSKKGLRILNFKKCKLIAQPSTIDAFYASLSAPVLADMSCCPKVEQASCANTDLAAVVDGANVVDEDDDALIPVVDGSDADDVYAGFGGGSAIAADADVDSAHAAPQQSAASSSALPDNLEQVVFPSNVNEVLQNLKFVNPETPHQCGQNSDLDFLLSKNAKADELVNFLMVNVMKCLTPASLKKNVTSSVAMGKVTMFAGGENYIHYVNGIFNEHISTTCFPTTFAILQVVRAKVIEMEANKMSKPQQNMTCTPFAMSDAGRGKLRYIGGWVVGTLRYRKMNYVKQNLYKQSLKRKVNTADKEVEALECLQASELAIFAESNNIASLQYTQSKQNMKKSLTNITDSAFALFCEIDERIHTLQTDEYVNKHGAQLYCFITTSLVNDTTLMQKWMALFSALDIETYIIEKLYNEVLHKYLNMSCAQHCKDRKRLVGATKQKSLRTKIAIGKRKKTSGSKGPGGKKRVDYPCGICGEDCTDSICCDKCSIWHHFHCVGLSAKEDYTLKMWYCKKCQ